MSDHDLFPEEPDEEQPAAELPESVPDDVPEADATEQTRPVGSDDATGPHEVGDRPEADALDQERIEADEDDDRR
jgi:hypothetical protein